MQGQFVSLPPWIYQILLRSAMAGTYIAFMQITYPFQVLTEPLCLAWGVFFLFAVEQQVGDQITWAGSECFFSLYVYLLCKANWSEYAGLPIA